jgi:sialidase-1
MRHTFSICCCFSSSVFLLLAVAGAPGRPGLETLLCAEEKPVDAPKAGAAEGRILAGAERRLAVQGGGYFPVLVKLPDGTLGAVVRGGAPHIGIGGRLDFIGSSDGGKTWSPPRKAVDSPWDDRNPALGVMKDGTLVLAYGEAHSYRPDGSFDLKAGPYILHKVTSPDQGKTWSAKEPIDPPFPSPSPYGKIIVLSDGTALLSVYQMPSDAARILRSKDQGKTWGDFSRLPGHDETQLLELADGRLLAFTRIEEKGEHGLLLCESGDKGRTWPSTRKLLKAGQWPYDATLLKSGHVLLSFGSRVGRYGAGVLLSIDGGSTWPEDRAVLLGGDSSSVDTGYPSTVQLSDGGIVTLYYAVGSGLATGEQAIAVRYQEQDIAKAMGR